MSLSEGCRGSERPPSPTSWHALRRLENGLTARAAPQTIELPVYDRIAQRPLVVGDSVAIHPCDVVIIDCTIALTFAPSFAPTHLYFVEIAEFERRRRVVREYLSRGNTAFKADAIYSARQLDEAPLIVESSRGATRIDASSFFD